MKKIYAVGDEYLAGMLVDDTDGSAFKHGYNAAIEHIRSQLGSTCDTEYISISDVQELATKRCQNGDFELQKAIVTVRRAAAKLRNRSNGR